MSSVLSMRTHGGKRYIDKDDGTVGSVASLVVDRPRTDLTFWAYLAAEIGFGASALASATRGASESVTA